MAICCILRTAFTDPGILPRATPDEILYMERLGNRSLNLYFRTNLPSIVGR
jgi:hypothetical protein